MDPTLGTASRILAAAGLQIPPVPEPLCDPAAIAAARAIISETPFRTVEEEAWAATLIRWASPDGLPHPRVLAREAGAAAPPALRPGAVHLSTDWGLLRLYSSVAATRKGWAVSGPAAAERIGAGPSSGLVILYVEEPSRIATIIDKTETGRLNVILLPFDGVGEAGAWNDEGIVWADPIQIILDCFGIGEAIGQADELTGEWEPNSE